MKECGKIIMSDQIICNWLTFEPRIEEWGLKIWNGHKVYYKKVCVSIYMQGNFEFRDFRVEFGVALHVCTDWHPEANVLAAS